MPIQAVAVAFVVVALVAIVWRFTPRTADGAMRLPTLIDRSVGMWLLRRALGRVGDADRVADDTPPAAPDWEANASRNVVPGAPLPTVPTRFVVSSASFRPQPATPVQPLREAGSRTVPVPSLAARSASAGHGSTYVARPRRPSGALAAQRRLAGAVALAVVAIAVTTIALGMRQVDGQVLSVTGTPAGSAGGGFVGGPADDSPAGSGEPSSSPAR
jgi:hypothetical protein